MKFVIERAFQKDFEKLKDPKLAVAILDVIENVSEASSVHEICNCKKNDQI